MNNIKTKAVYDAVLYQTSEARDKMLDFWSSFGEEMSEGEETELDNEMKSLQKLSERSAALAMISLTSADQRIDDINFAQHAKDNNLDVSDGDAIQFEDE